MTSATRFSGKAASAPATRRAWHRPIRRKRNPAVVVLRVARGVCVTGRLSAGEDRLYATGPFQADFAICFVGRSSISRSGLAISRSARALRSLRTSEAIASARAAFARCQFDEQGCGLGLRRLRAYRKEWDESRGVWKDRPRHDEASHGADTFLTFACSAYTPPSTLKPTKRDVRWVV